MTMPSNQASTTFVDVEKCVDSIIAKVGKRIVFGMPLGLGKPNHLVNALYLRAKSDPSIHLRIMTALVAGGAQRRTATWNERFSNRLLNGYGATTPHWPTSPI